MLYHHTVSGLASVVSVAQYQYNDHVEAWLRSQIKVVGPNNYYTGNYEAVILRYGFIAYGWSPDEARNNLMGQLGF